MGATERGQREIKIIIPLSYCGVDLGNGGYQRHSQVKRKRVAQLGALLSMCAYVLLLLLYCPQQYYAVAHLPNELW